MEHGPSDAGERGERKRATKSKTKESYKISFDLKNKNAYINNYAKALNLRINSMKIK